MISVSEADEVFDQRPDDGKACPGHDGGHLPRKMALPDLASTVT
ncbi:hypothetical protein ACFHYQ_04640 [Sphaerimonospora cavernae]|uniref:Uncharacterized protein n=1 Tax=Sphaerimonospora cavernae TaxID=1740611 RepID=A0ABV6TZF0_9ACTN